jgi:hypothetical protein
MCDIALCDVKWMSIFRLWLDANVNDPNQPYHNAMIIDIFIIQCNNLIYDS